MFQPIRGIARILLVPAALAAVALASQSAPSAAAANGKWSAPYATTTGGVIHHAAGNGKWC